MISLYQQNGATLHTMVPRAADFKVRMPPDPQPIAKPAQWVSQWLPRVAAGGTVLDLACGSGRHTRLALALGHKVVAVDRDLAPLGELARHPGVEAMALDLETAAGWPLGKRQFDGVIVVNYLHRPIMAAIVDAVAPGGMLIYQTFQQGHERFGRPRNPDFLLKPGELLDWALPALSLLAYESLATDGPSPALVQRIAARRPN